MLRLSTEDPATTVTTLAAVYKPETDLGKQSAGALYNLAAALTGRSVVMPETPDTPTGNAWQAALQANLIGLAMNQSAWLALSALSLGLLVFTWRQERSAVRAVPEVAPLSMPTPEPARAATAVAVAPRSISRPRPERSPGGRARPAGAATLPIADVPAKAPESQRQSFTFSFQADGEPFEGISRIRDPRTRKLVASCGLTSGPDAPEVAGGYLGFLVWLHENGRGRLPQTIGLAVKAAHRKDNTAAVDEWMTYARLEELVVPKPGLVRQFETDNLRAEVWVTDIAYASRGRQKEAALAGLSVRFDVYFKAQPAAVTPATPN
ncbi:MAG: hypothetical protein ACYC1C_05070 [Chloroflexota bacterium]